MIIDAPLPLPQIPARLVAGRLIVDECPYCLKPHAHGCGGDPRNPQYGHRVAHCKGPNPGYYLVPGG